MISGQQEFQGKGFEAGRIPFSVSGLIDTLLILAKSKVWGSVHMDKTDNKELCMRSRVLWNSEINKPKSLEVYYNNIDIGLATLSHEVGHLETMADAGGIAYYASSEVARYRCEYIASRWALDFIQKAGAPYAFLHKCAVHFQICLDGYRIDCPEQGRLTLYDKLVREVVA